jgi:4-amino-4-deoxy-L-arabinose transferase-like glycosyltransferase
LHATAARVPPRALLAAAIVVYAALAAALVSVGPGPGYDETLFHIGAVHMLTSHGTPPFNHPFDSWVLGARSAWPLMLMPYAGAVSFYLLLPPFALFGPGIVVARVTAALLAAFGMWGSGRLMASAAPGAAAAAVLLLAVHPGYLSNTVFNDSGLAYWMAAMGLIGLALRRYLAARTAAWAAAVGLACGFGVWTRLNFAWLIAAAILGALVAFGRRALPPRAHLAAAAAGGVLGAAPLLFYLARSHARDTLAFMAASRSAAGGSDHLVSRLHLMAVSLLYDDEHRRGVWDGPPALPAWHVAFIAVMVAASVIGGLLARAGDDVARWHRAGSVAFLALAAMMVATRLPVRGHHLLTLVPLAAMTIALAATRLVAARPRARPAVLAAAVLYGGIALFWDVSALRALPRVGGTGQWSDATMAIARYLDARKAPRVTTLDWGFHNSIYLVTAGRVTTRELFWYSPGVLGEPIWRNEIVPGELYLTHTPQYQYGIGATATTRFRQALFRSRLPYSTVVFRDRRGRPQSELVEVQP